MSFEDLQDSGTRPSSSRARIHNPSQAVAAGIFEINTAVASFRRLVDSIGTDKDTPDLRLNLHNARLKIMQLVKKTSANLKSLTQTDLASNFDPSKNIGDAKLARDFHSTLEELNKVQLRAAERESTYSLAVPSSSMPTFSTSGEVSDPIVDQGSQALLVERKWQQLVLFENEVVFNEAITEEREQGIREIQYEIGQVNEIFKDLAVLVQDQGVIIDDIHSNIEASSAGTIQARVQLSKASKSARSRTSWCWWLLVILVVVVIVVVLALII